MPNPRTQHGRRLAVRHRSLERLEDRLVLDSTVVFNEIMYNPGSPGDEAEFIELYNQMAVDMDISSWRLEGGIDFTFPEDVVVQGGGYLVVAKDPGQISVPAGVRVLGPFDRQLSNAGERIDLLDRSERRMDSMRYDDRGEWPLEPDGLGPSLAKRNPMSPSGPAAHWVSSKVVGGTPGQQNFPDPPADPTFVRATSFGQEWKVLQAGDTPPTNWPLAAPATVETTSGRAPLVAGVVPDVSPELQPIAGITVTASSELAGFDRKAEYLVNGFGLDGNQHGIAPDGAMWLNQGTFAGGPPDRDPEITFDLGSEREIAHMLVWNYNETLPNRPELLSRGVSSADIFVAGEDQVFHLLVENQNFEKGPGEAVDFAQWIDLGGTVARFVKLDIHGNFEGGDNNFVGLSEVQFLAPQESTFTTLPAGPTSFYAQTEFEFNGVVDTASVILRHEIDGGAIFYLNGSEIHRFNMPADVPIGPETLAASQLDEISISEPITLASTVSLRRGSNLLSVEIHRDNLDDGNVWFDAELSILGIPLKPDIVETLVPRGHSWTYDATGNVPADAWKAAEFDTSSWAGGPGATLVGYWPFDGDASAVMGEDGRLRRSPTFVPDRNSRARGAAFFNSSRRQLVEISGGGGLDGSESGTISMWVNWLGPQQGDCCGTFGAVLARQADRRFSDNILALDQADPGQAHIVWRQAGTPAEPLITSQVVVGDDQWHHVTVTFSPRETELFVDGVSQGKAVGEALHSKTDVALMIGAWADDGNSYSTSRVDDVAIWDGTLRPDEIAALAQQSLTPLDLATPQTAPYFAGNQATGSSEVSSGAGTYYFRREFDFSTSGETQLFLDLLVDDGAIVYLNGSEIYRHNLPTGELSHSTFAVSDVATASWIEDIVVPAQALTAGTNLLAVQVHGSGPADSDMLFDLNLTARTPEPLPGPVDEIPLVINEISAAGGASWFELLNIGSEDVSTAGIIAGVEGSEVTLDSVIIPPGELQVFAPDAFDLSTEVDVLYLQSPDRGMVIDAVQYDQVRRARHEDFGHSLLVPARPTPAEPNEFQLRDEVVINEIMYHFPPRTGSEALPPTVRGTELITFDATWRYSKPFTFGANDPPLDPGIDWANSMHTVDSANWFEAPAPIGFASGRLPVRLATRLTDPTLNTSYITTYYFETEFSVSSQQIAEFDDLALSHMVDDGAVFFLNGQEVGRFNMPDGPVVSHTLASSELSQAQIPEPITIPTELLVAAPASNRLSIEVHQSAVGDPDMVMAAALEGREIVDPGRPAVPYVEVHEQWIELFNRSDQTVDLSGWQLDDAIEFRFAEDTTIGAGGFLVVAANAAELRIKYPAIAEHIVGDFTGQLSHRTDRVRLRDELGNPADVVTYFEDGNWPAAADGGGSSLELVNPNSDNSVGLAWQASHESDNATWQTISYEGVAGTSSIGPDGQWEEFLFGMIDAGEVLLDDISVIQDPYGTPVELIQNGSFENDVLGQHPTAWRLIGNHRHGEVITDPADPTNQVLRFVATGPTEHMHNHAETTLKDGAEFVDIDRDTTYRITYRAKWSSGSNLLHSRLYFSRLARATPLARPTDLGTPAAVNSVFLENVGPTYQDFGHAPAVPEPFQPVTVAVQAQDPDGISALTLWYSVEGGDWNDVPMVLVEQETYTGQIPGLAASAIVQFYVEGEDQGGTTSTYPRRGPASRALYQVNDGLAATNGLHNFRMILTPDDADHLHSEVELMSNDGIGATFIYNEAEIFYDASLRLSGSQRARPFQPRLSFQAEFHSDHLFRGVHRSVTLDRSESTGFGQRELIYHHGMSHAGGGLPSEYNDLVHLITPRLAHTGSAELQLARYSDVFLDEQYANGGDGPLYEYELTYYPTTTANGDPEGRKRPQPDQVRGVAIRGLGPSKEDYRWAFLNKNRREADDYSRFMEFAETFGLRGEPFLEQINDVIDVDQWLRAFAFSTISGHGDNYGADGAQHNLQLYVRPSDQRVLFFPHDLDAFFSVNRALVGSTDLRKLMAEAQYERVYYGHVHDMIQTTFNEAYMSRWTAHYGSLLPEQRFDRHLDELIRRSDFLLDQIERQAPRVDFSITTEDTEVDTALFEIAGTGWVDVREVQVAGNDIPLALDWLGVTDWRVEVPLQEGLNEITLEAYDFQGNLIRADSVAVTSSVANPVAEALRITEVSYNPAEPSESERTTNPSWDNNDFEFIELANLASSDLNLLNVGFVDGVRLTLPAVVLPAGQRGVVVSNLDAFETRYGSPTNVLGVYTGRLSNAGERIVLADATGSAIHDFVLNDQWFSDADGGGFTLVVRDTSADYSRGSNWVPSVETNGSPGQEEPFALQAGDANRDQVFDQTDLQSVRETRKYLSADRASFTEGDWNGDGRFDQLDLVFALQQGHFQSL